MTDRLHPPPRYKPRGWGDELRRRLHNAGLSAWELADLLGVHESAITMDALPNQPLHIILELARRLDLHPADLTPYAEGVYQLPRYRDAEHPPNEPGADADAAAVLNALAHTGRPLTADYLAESLGWAYDRTAEALAHPELGGPYALRRAAPHHFTLSPRNDVQYGLRLIDDETTTVVRRVDVSSAQGSVSAWGARTTSGNIGAVAPPPARPPPSTRPGDDWSTSRDCDQPGLFLGGVAAGSRREFDPAYPSQPACQDVQAAAEQSARLPDLRNQGRDPAAPHDVDRLPAHRHGDEAVCPRLVRQ